MSKKINQENDTGVYSVYMTYEGNIGAECAVLCVDSLLIFGKIIRAFFGTTKYCNYFLNNKTCPNLKKCMYLHQLVTNKDIIIDDNTIFSYNEHLNMCKKIIDQSNLDINKILKESKKSKGVLPSADFIFLSEEQKEKFFNEGNIHYIKNNNNQIIENKSINNNLLIIF